MKEFFFFVAGAIVAGLFFTGYVTKDDFPRVKAEIQKMVCEGVSNG